ncbi:putative oxidoreductase [Papilio machaon]|uniref:Putative oxidoreductase n=1 Tax=Papilio machaon TaxID=76193 RepID=A0A0N1PJN6_PAPMA|nr:putative oxidoreductase [Papilio machaon]
MDIDFKNKVVIVTGASSRIGAEVAKLFARYEAKLVLVGRNEEERLKTVAEDCTVDGLLPLCILLDLTHPGSCETVINKTIELHGKIDVLINGAGKLKMASIFDQSIETFDEIIAINLRVPYYLCQLAVPYLKKTKGNIVNIAASLSHRHISGFLTYNITKNAIQLFTEQAAVEATGEGIRINSINPGCTKTNLLLNMNVEPQNLEAAYKNISKHFPTRLPIEASEVAKLICIIASDLFPDINGSNIGIDGASSAL